MTNISKKSVKKETLSNIDKQLKNIFLSLKKETESGLFVEEFFTDSERIMLSKRLAIIFMLNEGVPFGVIEKTLKVSTATIRKIAVIIDRGGYQSIVKILSTKKAKEIFWMDLEKALRAGLPKYGKGRWDFLKDLK